MAKAKFTVARDVEAKVVPMVVGPTVHIARQVERQAKDNAPPLKNWVSVGDNRVRPEHVLADLDGPVPGNLRFRLHSTQWDREHRAQGMFSYIEEPPHEGDSRAEKLMWGCRCHVEWDADGIRDLIHTEPPQITGKKVRVLVVCEGNQVVESEFGTVYPGDLVADGAFFMRDAAATVAAKRRSAQTFDDARQRVVLGS